MSLKRSLSLVTFLFFVSVLPASAVGNGNPKNTLQKRQNLENIRPTLRPTIKPTLKPTLIVDRLALRRKNAQDIAAKMRLQFTNRLAYLDKIKSQLQAKITNLSGTKNMTQATAELAKYDTSPTSKYALALKNFDDTVAKIATLEKPMTIVPELRASAKNVLTELKNLHQTLVNTLKFIVKAPKLTPTP